MLLVRTTANAQQLPLPAPQAKTPSSKAPSSPRTSPETSTGQLEDGTRLPPPAPSEVAPQSPEDIIEIPSTTPTPPAALKSVSVGGVDITGLRDAAAVSKLQKALGPKLAAKVVLGVADDEYESTRSDLGAKIPYLKLIAQARKQKGDVPLRFEVDTKMAGGTMERLAAVINQPTPPADDVAAVHGTMKLKLSVDGSVWRIKQALEAQPPQSSIELVVATIYVPAPTPPKAPADAAPPAGFPHLLATFSTPYDASLRGRTSNLRMAARHVNGSIVAAGDVFSTNRAIGPRNAEAGWREAKMFVDGQVVTGVGAGICQCATTIYNAALLAGLPIVERHPHQFRVMYAPASRDATLYWGSKDLRFRNTTNGPIYIQTYVRGGRFHARLYGTEPLQVKAEVTSRTLSRRGGTRSEAYRIVQTSSGTRREFLSRDYYKPHP